MLFSSLTFLFCFLPATVGLYFFARPSLRNIVLLLASIFFYAWGEPKYLPIIFTTITMSYIGAIVIEKFNHKKLWLTLFLLLDLSWLFYFKYTNFFLENLGLLFNKQWSLKVVLPLGISFYTFQAISYLVDVYKGQVKAQKNYLKIALYICLFPQLIAGPIVKYHDVADQIDNRVETLDQVYYGIRRFIIGLAKKVLVANILAVVVSKLLAQNPENYTTSMAWICAIFSALQVYYDFSGYSDMAIGLGAIFGFKFLENFNYPYISKSMSEYWHRWHISLSTWFRDYFYFPMGGSRVAVWRAYVNLFLCMLMVGIWHGASWAFVFWGSWNGICLIFEKYTRLHKIQSSKFFVNFGLHIYTIFCFVIARVFFISPNFTYAKNLVLNMFGLLKHKEIEYNMAYYFDRLTVIISIIAFICCVPIFRNILNWGEKRRIYGLLVNILIIFLLILCCTQLAASTYNPFIYFRF